MIGNFQVIWVNHARIHKLGRVTSSILDHFGWGIDRSLSPSNPKPRNIAGGRYQLALSCFPRLFEIQISAPNPNQSKLHPCFLSSVGRASIWWLQHVTNIRRAAARVSSTAQTWTMIRWYTAHGCVTCSKPYSSDIPYTVHQAYTLPEWFVYEIHWNCVCVYLYSLLCIIYIYIYIDTYTPTKGRIRSFAATGW